MVDSATSVNGLQRRSDFGSTRSSGNDSQRSSGYGSHGDSFDKTSDTEISACDNQLTFTNNWRSGPRMTRSMSRQLSDVRQGVFAISMGTLVGVPGNLPADNY